MEVVLALVLGYLIFTGGGRENKTHPLDVEPYDRAKECRVRVEKDQP